MSDGVEWTVSADMRELRASVENENGNDGRELVRGGKVGRACVVMSEVVDGAYKGREGSEVERATYGQYERCSFSRSSWRFGSWEMRRAARDGVGGIVGPVDVDAKLDVLGVVGMEGEEGEDLNAHRPTFL